MWTVRICFNKRNEHMARILLIESTTKACSAGIATRGDLIAFREEVSTDYSHSAFLTVFIEETLKEAGMKAGDLDAVAVSQGPGSYTGLRIGVSVAKGICFGQDIPLLAIDTMKALAVTGIAHISSVHGVIPPASGKTLFCPMIDARRMEVYYALFDRDLLPVRETRAEVMDGQSLREEVLRDARIYYFGDGAAKCRDVMMAPNLQYVDGVHPSVRGMAREAEKRFSENHFEDLAYFEPYYLKNFVAGKPKVKGLYS